MSEFVVELLRADGSPGEITVLEDGSFVADVQDNQDRITLDFEEGTEGFIHLVQVFTEQFNEDDGELTAELEVYFSKDPTPLEPYEDAPRGNIGDGADYTLIGVLNVGGEYTSANDFSLEANNFLPGNHNPIPTYWDVDLDFDLPIASETQEFVSGNFNVPVSDPQFQTFPDGAPQVFAASVLNPFAGTGENFAWDPGGVILQNPDQVVSLNFNEDLDGFVHVLELASFPDPGAIGGLEGAVVLERDEVGLAIVKSNSAAPPIIEGQDGLELVQDAMLLALVTPATLGAHSSNFIVGFVPTSDNITADVPLRFLNFSDLSALLAQA